MDQEQTIWLAPRTTGFTEICEQCEEEDPGLYRDLHAVVRGHLGLERQNGWATCPKGHTMRVLRITAATPPGALRG
jgi:hypothetical protein